MRSGGVITRGEMSMAGWCEALYTTEGLDFSRRQQKTLHLMQAGNASDSTLGCCDLEHALSGPLLKAWTSACGAIRK